MYGGCVDKPPIEPLLKEIHDAEREIDAIECKIQFADLKKTYPHEYAAMRSEQENHRQQILHCKASLDNHVKAEHVEDPRPFDNE
jgi:predicted  nucleic acid-binding Zn-ribbon protein